MDNHDIVRRMRIRDISNNSHAQLDNVHICVNDKPSCGEHIHDCYEIEMVISGTLSEIINGKEYKAKVGDVFLLCPNDVHSLAYNQNDELSIFNIMFDNIIFSENVFIEKNILLLSENGLSHTELNRDDYQRLSSCLYNAVNEYKYYEDNTSVSIIRNSIELVLLTIFRYHAIDCRKKFDKRVIQALDYIEKNYANNISIMEVANMVGLTKNYFARLFYQSTGTLFNDYVSQFRMKQIELKLVDTDESIIDICFENGYKSLSTFYRDFKEYSKMTPSQYRRKNSR